MTVALSVAVGGAQAAEDVTFVLNCVAGGNYMRAHPNVVENFVKMTQRAKVTCHAGPAPCNQRLEQKYKWVGASFEIETYDVAEAYANEFLDTSVKMPNPCG